MEELNSLLNFILHVIVTTFSQLFWLLGLLFVFGLILYAFARFTRITYVKSVGYKLDVIFTGWIGTPVHELGHAIFCIIFGHSITDIKLYAPNSEDGTIGYVYHTWNRNSTWQRIGNFFIGVGPIIFGAVVLYALLYYLLPHMQYLFSGLREHSDNMAAGASGEFTAAIHGIRASTLATLSGLFQTVHLTDYRFWIFLYLAICISSHMELSPPDIKGATGGLISLVVFFLFLNTFILAFEAFGISGIFGSLWKYIKLESYEAAINKWVGLMGALFVFASIISGLNFLFSYVVLSLYNLISGRGFINPIWISHH